MLLQALARACVPDSMPQGAQRQQPGSFQMPAEVGEVVDALVPQLSALTEAEPGEAMAELNPAGAGLLLSTLPCRLRRLTARNPTSAHPLSLVRRPLTARVHTLDTHL